MKEVREQLAAVLAADPANPSALIWLATLDEGKLTAEVARAAARGAPSDHAGWLSLSSLTNDPAEKESALRKAVALGPDCATCNNNLAWLLVQSNRAKDALPYANRAVDLAPWDGTFIDTLATVAAGLGKCEEALRLEARAVRISGGQAAIKQQLEVIKSRCEKR